MSAGELDGVDVGVPPLHGEAHAEGPDDDLLRRAAAIAAFLLAGLGAVSTLLFVAAFQFRSDWFADPALAVAGGEGGAPILQWAALTDLFSYYLPVALIALAIRVAIRPRSPLIVDIATLAALGYVIAGSIGVTALASAGPAMMREYDAPGADKAVTAVAFRLLIEVVFRGLWQTLDPILLGFWFLVVGRLTQPRRHAWGALAMALGAVLWLGVPAGVFGLALVRDLLSGIVAVLGFAWALWLGALLARRSTL